MQMEWECEICGYIHEDDERPDMCPVCGAPASKFVERYEDEDLLDVDETDNGGDEDDYYGEFQ